MYIVQNNPHFKEGENSILERMIVKPMPIAMHNKYK